ncbi:uncharacterized protein LOC124893114 [Capsicum annuum]|uniref:uncharacterized protein LOC124893114 n=1 Tax=Capsicum annuum TaxID=4072 RepID=UPI001FB17DC0|nr:uncharacterized protein LOC124893114 [Capsicum annuum]
MPDYTLAFVVETDASGKGIGAVLMQEGHPLDYISKSLAPKPRAMSVYDRELLALLFVRHKYNVAVNPGLLQPLLVPDGVWTDICLDFVEVLPKFKENKVILVLVDRLGKYGHFLPLAYPYTAQSVAQCFPANIFKLHGMPNILTSDRDPIFLSSFWEELFNLQGVQLQRSTAYHSQTDSQTEVLNRTMETYLRCFCFDNPKDWCSYLPLAEWWYNTTYHIAIKCTPYEALYGQKPLIHLSYLIGEGSMRWLTDPWLLEKQVSLAVRLFPKLATKYYSPYVVDAKVGAVAYRLLLPSDVLIHLVFHVSQLKRCHEVPSNIHHPQVIQLSSPHRPQPEAILDRRLIKRGNRAVGQVLVKWSDIADSQATWELEFELMHKFPAFHP